MLWTCNKCASKFEPTPGAMRRNKRTCTNCNTAKYVQDRIDDPEKYRTKAIVAERKRYSDPQNKARADTRCRTRYLVRVGKLKRLPCEVCGELKTHAHHGDYKDAVNVRWLCPKHHALVHVKENDQKVFIEQIPLRWFVRSGVSGKVLSVCATKKQAAEAAYALTEDQNNKGVWPTDLQEFRVIRDLTCAMLKALDAVYADMFETAA